ncbi:hypothetical protein [Taibaiella chishuiensis]|uniref:Transglutaminase superfamily protein n=1 Tax=Taibaiella chishuiensis TaxID=1434707 RepID=A0A2P8D0X0_9BACT|nr:hypothetical protein [Taibaiella chishuiensis]PSK90873.1 hypothetical protein B0I18_107285 [Taibaiella chishuiensis]
MKYLIKGIWLIILLLSCFDSRSEDRTRFSKYQSALDSIVFLTKENYRGAFKKAIFMVESTYLNDKLDYEVLNKKYIQLAAMASAWGNANRLQNYTQADSVEIIKNRSIFQLIKDTVKIQMEKDLIASLPYQYNFDDYDGKKDWSNTFVYTLLKTGKGNCHSLPYLYKILADELGAKCWLALAPNHMYIKNYSKRDGWYNTELTSGDFPIDAWLTTTGYISLTAIQNGLYCDTLSNQQSIALCAIDLAKAYEKETKNYYDGFILQCCDLVLKYHSVNPQALLLKAETLKRIYQLQDKEGDREAKSTYNDMEKLYVSLYDLGYREMPEKMYKDWLRSLQTQKSMYSNRNIKK